MLRTALFVGAGAGLGFAAQPPSQATPPAQPVQPDTTAAPADAPDGDFIEFLGADDHGDAAWWEMLKQAPAGSQRPAAPAPKDSNS